MTIGQKLTSAFGATLAGMVLLTVDSQSTIQSLRRELNGAVNGSARRQQLASDINAATADMAGTERGIALSSILSQAAKAGRPRRRTPPRRPTGRLREDRAQGNAPLGPRHISCRRIDIRRQLLPSGTAVNRPVQLPAQALDGALGDHGK